MAKPLLEAGRRYTAMKVEDVVREGFAVFKVSWLSFILASVVVTIGSIFIITAPPLFFGLYHMSLKAQRGESVEVFDVLKGFNYFVTSWVLSIVAVIAIGIGLIFLIIPGLALAVLFTYAIPIALKEELGAIESLKKSFNIGKENLEFTIILALVMWGVNAIGGYIPFVSLVTFPFTTICIAIAAVKLTEGN
jgi:uncharacterized membrane protein